MAKTSSEHVRMPPQNLEAETSVLGSLMLDKDAIIKVADLVKVGDFYKEDHNLIYEAMLKLYEEREPIDVLSLANGLEEKGKLERVGGSSYLASLVNSVPSAANVVHYAKVVQKKALLRRLISAASEIVEMGYDESEDVQKVLDEAEQKLFGISQKYLKQDFIPIKNALALAWERIDELHRGDRAVRGIPSGFKDLDDILSGFQNSDLIILAARPSVGKTSFALDLARQIGVKSKVPVGIFSLEMSSDQLVDRMIAAQGGLDLWKLRTGHLDINNVQGQEASALNEAFGILNEAPIFIDDTSVLNILEMRTMARRLQAEHKLGVIIIDYLQLMEGRSRQGDNRVQEISEISRGLKQLAKELSIPVIALSQLSRSVETRKDRPKLSDLRESGSIEQDADVVILLSREDQLRPDNEKAHYKNVVNVDVAKHRNGPVGLVQLHFRENSASFENFIDRQDSPQ